MATTSVFLPGESHGQRSLANYGPWDCEQLDTTEQLSMCGKQKIMPPNFFLKIRNFF